MVNISSNEGAVNVTSTIGITKEQIHKLTSNAFADRIKAWCKDFHVTHCVKKTKGADMPESCLGMSMQSPVVPGAVEKHMQKLHEDFLAFIDSLEEETDQGVEHSDSKKMMCDIDTAVEKLCKEKGVNYMLITTHKEKEGTLVYASGNIPAHTAMVLLCDACYRGE